MGYCLSLQVLAEDSHVMGNTSDWLARHSSVQRDVTVDYNVTSDYGMYHQLPVISPGPQLER